MSTRLFNRNAVILAKLETTEGVDPTPTGSANAMLVSDLSIEPLAGSEVSLDYIRPYFGSSPTIRIEDYVTCSFTVDVAGTSTAGTAAPWGPLMRACAFSETLSAAAVTGTAQAGGASSITLASGASATNNLYVGMTVSRTGGTDFGTPRTIIAYNGTTKVATVDHAFTTPPDETTQYSIGPCAVYLPVSSAIESVTIYYNVSGVRHKLTAAKGTVSFDLSANARPTIKFSFTGVYNPVADASEATPVFTSWQVPAPVSSANTKGLLAGKLMDGTATGLQVQKFTMDMANEVKHRQLIGAAGVILTDRKPKGSISFEATTVAFNDWFAQIRSSTTAPFLIENGTVAGNTVALFMPKAQLNEPKYSDSDGIVMMDCGILALPDVANDEVRIVVK